MTYYINPNLKDPNNNSSVYYLDIVSDDFKLFYYNIGWLTYRPETLYNLYPEPLPIIEDACYSGYTYDQLSFEGTYFGTSLTPTNKLLFVYKQFNTDILFQSIYPPTSTFKVPTKSNNLILESDFINSFIGIKLDNTNDTVNLILTTD